MSRRVTFSDQVNRKIAMRALYELWCPGCCLPDGATDYETLSQFLSSDATPDKIKKLIEGGFAEICAVSYFLGCDLPKNNMALINDRVVLLDIQPSSDFISYAIVPHALEYFPFLKDGGPIIWPATYSPSAQYYTLLEVGQFEKLDRCSVFVNKAYNTFLKIIFTADNTIYHVMTKSKKNVDSLKLSEEIGMQKKSLIRVLQETQKLMTYWEKLSAVDIQSLMHPDGLASQGDCFYHFSISILAGRTEAIFSELTALIDTVSNDYFPNHWYTVLVTFQDVLFADSMVFFETTQSRYLRDAFLTYLNKTNNLLRGISVLLPPEDIAKKERIQQFFETVSKLMMLMRRDFDCYFDDTPASQTQPDSVADEFDFVEDVFPTQWMMMHHTSPFIGWIKAMSMDQKRLRNKKTIETLLLQTQIKRDESKKTVYEKTKSIFSFATASVSSLLSQTSSSRLLLWQKPPEFHSDHLIERTHRATTANQLIDVLLDVLSATPQEEEKIVFCKQWMIELFTQYVVEQRVCHQMRQLHSDPLFSVHLRDTLNHATFSFDVMELVTLCKLMLTQKSQNKTEPVELDAPLLDSDGEDDFATMDVSGFRPVTPDAS